MLIFFTDC